MRDVPQHGRLAHELRSFHKFRLCPCRSPFQPELHALPHRRQDFGDGYGMYQLPLRKLSGRKQPEPCCSRLPAGLRDMPQHNGVDGRCFQSCHDELPADGHTHQPAVLNVPQQRAIQRSIDQLHILPSDEVQQHNESEPCCSRLPAGLYDLSQHTRMDRGRV